MKYALQNIHTKEIMGYESSNNFGDKNCPQQFTLVESSKKMWLVDDPAQAGFILSQGVTPWYLSDYNNPTHTLNPLDYQVVSVEIVTKVVALNFVP